jgi:lipoyl(octanoyl) transferase
MDLQPFNKINPCGYVGLKMTQLSNFVNNINISNIAVQLSSILSSKLI